ncbi:hypothetical protein [Streptomyces showdoensis]|uniref:GCN5 family acetyltransferase n=1 Tax=Streptomyces showdoensis TaxID=68268 RepID=A0A2P2GXE1_STREW|nr:hypothetical protein [Streptomyces showdoensis]KKZ75615.1 hypothetical protein VO63_01980 [Streptomyces showdoensis]
MIIEAVLDEAVRNNAVWCDTMCRAHGRAGEFGARAWTSSRRTPLYYPDAVTLTASADAADVLAGIDRSVPGASVKDSHARLDLAAEGFRLLFEARWIHRPAGLPRPAAPAGWRPVTDPAGLAAWALAWSDGGEEEAALFRPELLADPATRIIVGHAPDGRVLGGAVLTDSGTVTGVSNLFTTPGTEPSTAWAAALSHLAPDRAAVGYESGDDLAPALEAGFETIGPLRVWLDA